MKDNAVVALVALALGFSLSRIGFSSWDEAHGMFTFTDLRLLLTFVAAVAILVVAWVVIGKLTNARWLSRTMHPGTIVGGVLFGAGWALSGACPAIALVQLGEGQLGALVTLAGILIGNYVYGRVHERYFRWSATGCGEG